MLDGPLDRALWPARHDLPIRDITVGDAAARSRRALADGDRADRGQGRRHQPAAAGPTPSCSPTASGWRGALLTRFAPGERIAIWAPNAPEWVLIEYAAALAGLTLVTVNPGYVARELDFVLRQSNAAGLFLVAEHRGNPMAETAARGRRRHLPALREICDIEDEAALFRGAGDRAAAARRRSPAIRRKSNIRRAPPAFPRASSCRTAAWPTMRAIITRSPSCADGAATLAFTPLFHTTGCSMAVLGAIQIGSPMVLLRQFDPDAALDLIEARAGRDVPGRADHADRDVRGAESAAARPVAACRSIAVGGAMVAPELVREVSRACSARASTPPTGRPNARRCSP